jgi:transketolase
LTEKKKSIRGEYGKTLALLGEKYQDIVVLDADLSGSTKTGVFAREFPDRFFNMGVSEQDMIGTAAGLACVGKIPFVSTFAIFATGRAWEPVRQSVAYSKVNVKIVASHGGVTVGEDGGSHQSVEDIGLMRILPNMTVIVPADATEMRKVLEWAVDYNGPVYVRSSRIEFPCLYDDAYAFTIGKGDVVRDGMDATIVACGYMVHQALATGDLLAKRGIRARIINMSTIKPLDTALLIEAARETGGIVTAEEHSVIGGLGSAVAETVSEEYPVPIKRIGVPDQFGTSGSPNELLAYFGLTPVDIEHAVLDVLKLKERKQISAP